MAYSRSLALALLLASSVTSAFGDAGLSFSARSAVGKCTKDKTRCAGAPGYPYVEYAPCCEEGSRCIEDAHLGWGKWCIKPKKESYGKCYLNDHRCMGAPGKAYIPFHPCCGDGKCVKDKKLGWGYFCKDGSYGEDYEVSEYHDDYKVVDFKKEKEKKIELEKKKGHDKKYEKEYEKEYKKEKKDYKEYVDKYEKKYFEDKEKYGKDYGKDYSKKDYKSYDDYAAEYGYGYGHSKKKKVVDKPMPGHGVIKDIFANLFNTPNVLCNRGGEATAAGGVTPVVVPATFGRAQGRLIFRVPSSCSVNAATFPLRIISPVVTSVCTAFRAAVPGGICGVTAVIDGVTIRMAETDVETAVVRQAGSPAVIVIFEFGYPCTSAATAVGFIGSRFDSVTVLNTVCNNVVTTTTPPAVTSSTAVAMTTTGAPSVVTVTGGGPSLQCPGAGTQTSPATLLVNSNPSVGASESFSDVDLNFGAGSLCPGDTPQTVTRSNAQAIVDNFCAPLIAEFGSSIRCVLVVLEGSGSSARQATMEEPSTAVAVRQVSIFIRFRIRIIFPSGLVVQIRARIRVRIDQLPFASGDVDPSPSQ